MYDRDRLAKRDSGTQVIDNEICFKSSLQLSVYELFHDRAVMHSKVGRPPQTASRHVARVLVRRWRLPVTPACVAGGHTSGRGHPERQM